MNWAKKPEQIRRPPLWLWCLFAAVVLLLLAGAIHGGRKPLDQTPEERMLTAELRNRGIRNAVALARMTEASLAELSRGEPSIPWETFLNELLVAMDKKGSGID